MQPKSKQLRKIWTYATCAVALTALGIVLQPHSWKGTAQLHTLMELAATMLALTIGVVALIRYYSKKQNAYLFVGIGFFGTTFLDGYHAVVTSTFFAAYLPSGLAALIPWSWNASRTFLAVLMVLSLWAWRREQRLGAVGQISERFVYASVGLLTLGSFLFFTLVPLPRAYYPEFFFGRPEEFVAGALFLVALMGYLQKSAWRQDQFENWLVLSLIFGFVCQVVVMSRSFTLFDSMFDLAHSLKVLSYLCVLTGLFINTYHLFGEAQHSREILAESNGFLQLEAKRRKQSQAELVVAIGSLQEQKDASEAAQKAFHDQAARIKAIVESATDAIITISSRGIVESFNAAAESMFAYNAEEVIGENVKILMPAPYQQQHDGYLKDYMETGLNSVIGIGREVIGKRKDGSTFPMDLAVSEVELKDRRLFTGIVRGISERKEAEQQQAALNLKIALQSQEIAKNNAALEKSNEELKQFAYVASHDLQEPLRKVNSFCQLLREEYSDQLDENAQSYIRYAVDGATRMRNLVADLLDYSRVETQGKSLEPTDAGVACAVAIDNLQAAIEESGAKLSVDQLPTIEADQSQLIRLFQNLIGNAIKYCRESPPEIMIGVQEQGDDWVFSVQDNGIGMGSQYYEQIFVMFKRLHASDEYSGTGIGLAICKRIVDRFGGRIWVESETDVGSTFFLSVPKLPGMPLEGATGHEHNQPAYAQAR